jgi:hypothetical protein
MTTQDRSEASRPSESTEAKKDPYAEYDEGQMALKTIRQFLAEKSARTAESPEAPSAPQEPQGS